MMVFVTGTFRSRVLCHLVSYGTNALRARKRFYGPRSVFKRLLSARHMSNLFILSNYLFINFLCRREAAEREDYPLGDLSLTNEILSVSEKALDEKAFHVRREERFRTVPDAELL